MTEVVNRDGIYTWWNLPLAHAIDGQTICGITTNDGEAVVDRTYGHPVIIDAGAGNDDHNTASLIIPDDAPPIAASNRHDGSSSLRVRVGTEIGDIDSLGPQITLTAGSGVSYNQIWRNSNDVWILCRAGNWGFFHSDDYGATWSGFTTLMSASNGYIGSTQIGSTVRCVAYTHPSTSDHDVRYFEIDLAMGNITNRDGTVLGNLDGTNLPLSLTADLETVFSPSGADKTRLYGVSKHTDPEIVVSTFTTTTDGVYRYIWWDGAAWQSESVVAEGGIIGYTSAAHYAGGASFPDDTSGGELFVSRKDGSTWKIEKWVKSGTWAMDTLYDSSDTRILARPWPVEGSGDLVWFGVDSYPDYTSWTGGKTLSTLGTGGTSAMLRFTESFDDGLYDLGKWNTFTGTSALDVGRRSTNGLRIMDYSNFDGRAAIPATPHVIVGVAVNWRVNSAADQPFLGFYDTPTSNLQVQIITKGTTGDLEVWRGGVEGTPGVLLGGASSVVTIDGFHYFEVELLIDETDGFVVIHRDGVEILNLTGIDTRDNAAGPNVDSVRFTGNTSTPTTSLQAIIDDIYIADNVPGEVDAMLGDVEIRALLPDADGDINDWTPDSGVTNFERVDEVPPDDDTSYVETTTATNVDLYEMEDIVDTGAVRGLIAYAYAKNAGGGSIAVKHAIRRGVTTEVGAAQTLPTIYGVVSEVFETDPHTAVAWQRSDLNNTQFGLEAQ